MTGWPFGVWSSFGRRVAGGRLVDCGGQVWQRADSLYAAWMEAVLTDFVVNARGGARIWLLDRPTLALGLAAVSAGIVFSVPMIPYLGFGDFLLHIQYAKDIHQLADVVSPHFLFQFLLIGTNRVTGMSYEAAAILLMSLSYALMATLIALRMTVVAPLLAPWRVAALAVLVLLASHVFLQTLFKPNFYNGYIAPTTYHNPTQVLSKAMAIVVMCVYFAIAFEGRQGAVWRLLLPVGIVLSAIAKPSFLIAFLPCACAVEFFRAVNDSWRPAARKIALIAIPACLVLTLQYVVTFDQSGGGLGFAPFLVYGGATQVLPKLPGSLLFPLVAAAVIWRERAWSNQLLFGWFLYAVGMVLSVCPIETGPRMMAGNFAWTGQTVTFLLYVESTIALMALAWLRAWPAWGAFALHVCFGTIWYSAALFLPVATFL